MGLSPIPLLFSQVLLSPLPPNAPWSATMRRPSVCPSSALRSLAHSPPPGDGTGSARRPTLSRACTAAESPEPRPLTLPTESRLRCGHANPASPSVTLRGSDDRGAEEQAANSEEPLSLTSRPSWNFLAKSLWGKDVTEAELVAFTVGRHNGRVGRTFSAYMRRLALVMM